MRNPNGKGSGWIDSKGRVWIPTDHKGTHAPHWDREKPGGGYENVYPFTRHNTYSWNNPATSWWIVGAAATIGIIYTIWKLDNPTLIFIKP